MEFHNPCADAHSRFCESTCLRLAVSQATQYTINLATANEITVFHTIASSVRCHPKLDLLRRMGGDPQLKMRLTLASSWLRIGSGVEGGEAGSR